jgi:hypothetical protein
MPAQSLGYMLDHALRAQVSSGHQYFTALMQLPHVLPTYVLHRDPPRSVFEFHLPRPLHAPAKLSPKGALQTLSG